VVTGKRVLTIAVKALFLGLDSGNSGGNRVFKGKHVVSPESLFTFHYMLLSVNH